MSNKENNREIKSKERIYDFDTISGEKLENLYSPSSIDSDFLKNINHPGEYPYTRDVSIKEIFRLELKAVNENHLT